MNTHHEPDEGVVAHDDIRTQDTDRRGGRTTRRGRLVASVLATLAVGTVVVAAAGAAIAGPRAEFSVSRSPAQAVRAHVAAALNAPSGSTVAPTTCVQLSGDLWAAPTFAAPGELRATCAIPSGARLLVDLGGTICFEDETLPADEVAACARAFERSAPSLQTLIVDGRAVAEPATRSTGAFVVDIAEDNLFELPAGPTTVAVAGRSVVLSDLADGTHRIRLVFSVAPNADDIEFDVDLRLRVTVG